MQITREFCPLQLIKTKSNSLSTLIKQPFSPSSSRNKIFHPLLIPRDRKKETNKKRTNPISPRPKAPINTKKKYSHRQDHDNQSCNNQPCVIIRDKLGFRRRKNHAGHKHTCFVGFAERTDFLCATKNLESNQFRMDFSDKNEDAGSRGII